MNQSILLKAGLAVAGSVTLHLVLLGYIAGDREPPKVAGGRLQVQFGNYHGDLDRPGPSGEDEAAADEPAEPPAALRPEPQDAPPPEPRQKSVHPNRSLFPSLNLSQSLNLSGLSTRRCCRSPSPPRPCLRLHLRLSPAPFRPRHMLSRLTPSPPRRVQAARPPKRIRPRYHLPGHGGRAVKTRLPR